MFFFPSPRLYWIPCSRSAPIGLYLISCVMNCIVQGPRRVQHLSRCHRLGYNKKKREARSRIHGFMSKYIYVFTQPVLPPIPMFPGFNFVSPLHPTMSVWLFFPSLSLINAQLQPNTLTAAAAAAAASPLYSMPPFCETCSMQGGCPPTGSGSEQPPSPLSLCAR